MAFYALQEDFSLRGWRLLPYAIVKKGVEMPEFLRKDVFDVLELCDGAIDFSMLPEEYEARAEEFVKMGVASKSAAPVPIREEQKYRFHDARFIRTALWSITGKCNCSCRHCYMSASEGRLGELSHEAIFEIIRQLDECGVRSVALTGGEPLIRRDFWEIVDALLEKGIRVTTIYSNGFLVNEGFARKLLDRGIRPEINMSFDGVGWHDYLRGVDGAEQRVNAAFAVCKEAGIPTGAEMCLHQGNKHTLRESVNHLASLGCRSLKTNPVASVGAWAEGGYGTSVEIDELFQLYLDYIPHFYEDGAPLSLMLGGFFCGQKGNTNYYRLPMVREGSDPEKCCLCSHARNVLYISPESRALPCLSLSGMEIQKNYPLITEIGLKRCLTESTYLSLIETKAAEVLRHNPECADCEYRARCMGGCRAAALDNTPDDILGRDMGCCTFYKNGWEQRARAAAEEAIARFGEKP